jgi:hypothetical protein
MPRPHDRSAPPRGPKDAKGEPVAGPPIPSRRSGQSVRSTVSRSKISITSPGRMSS